ncbi:MAG: BCCT family transporter [Kiritimatiellae bacterium]|nr:BCCT family transporter [Kiritimatiellia bacterium]
MKSVFKVSALVSGVIILVALAFPGRLYAVTSTVRDYVGDHFGWFYLLLATVVVGVCLYCIMSPIGRIRLGDPDSRPEHSDASWLAMLFSAGMGIGLVFYGAAEPLSHFAVSSPEAELYSPEALEDALKYSFFHYGIHAWAIYGVIALALAYFQFRKKENILVSATLKPLFGNLTDGWLGIGVDSLTIIATIVGVATTLGLGAAQINGGLNSLWGFPENDWSRLAIILLTSVFFIWSAVAGIDKGIKTLSNLNSYVAIGILALVLAVGPTVQILESTIESFGSYINNFIELSFRTESHDPAARAWIQKWTIMYWAWWISWSPFVGIFIARISKGRTIREFVTYVLLVPTLFSCLWFAVFGTLSTSVVSTHRAIASLPSEKMLFGVLEKVPFGTAISVASILLVFSFFITSADSATVVLAMESEGGSLKPKKSTKFIWGATLSLTAVALMFAGGLDALQDMMIVFALPFAVLLVLIIVSLVKELRYEQHQMGLFVKARKYPEKDEPFRSYEDGAEG